MVTTRSNPTLNRRTPSRCSEEGSGTLLHEAVPGGLQEGLAGLHRLGQQGKLLTRGLHLQEGHVLVSIVRVSHQNARVSAAGVLRRPLLKNDEKCVCTSEKF